jgi:butyryl-CoA dehydrogenase
MLTDDEVQIQDLARRFSRERLAPNAAAWEQAKDIPPEVIAEMGQLGLFGLLLPDDYGGANASFTAFVLAMEELAAGNGGLSTLYHVHTLGAAGTIASLGNEQQKRTWLPRMVSGEVIGAAGFSEPGAGSDMQAIRTRAVKDGEGWRLNGTKQFITNGARAGIYLILAVTDPDAGSQGMSFFLIPAGTPGLRAGPREGKMGQLVSDTTQVILDDCWVPDTAVMGRLNLALAQAMGLLSVGRISIAAQAIGIAQAAYGHALAYAKERRAFGRVIADHQAVAFRLADMAAGIEVARAHTLHVARLYETGEDCTRQSSIAKLVAGEMAERVCSDALQIHGGYGYLTDYPLERLCRDVRVCQIYEGTNDIQRLIISRSILA